MRLSIRWRLTLWYGGVLAAILTACGTAVFLAVRHQLRVRLEDGLTEELYDVRSVVQGATDEAQLRDWLKRRFAGHAVFDFHVSRAGGTLFVSDRLTAQTLPLPAAPSAEPNFRSVQADGRRWRVLSVEMDGPAGPLTVQVARSLSDFDREVTGLLAALLLIGPLAWLGAISGGYFLAWRALAPVDAITRTAGRITAERLGERIVVSGAKDELGALAETLNGMIERLERSFTQMQRFTADAAHELRTPLAVIRSEAEVALRHPRSPEEYSQVLVGVLEEVIRLSQLADQLLFLSRQDAGLHPTVREEVAADEVVAAAVANLQLVAQERGVTLAVLANAPCRLCSDGRQLRRVLYNLLDNALKYTPTSGAVNVSAVVRGGDWILVVRDTGVGIPQEHLPHIFERFYRVEASRTTEGIGLGLAICRSIISGLGGTITLNSTAGAGTTVEVVLPIGSCAAHD